jgi:hypothetical protein
METASAGAGPVEALVTPASASTRGRAFKALAAILWLLVLVLAFAELWMIAVTLDRPSDQWGIRGYEAGLALAFGSMGALVAFRRPRNLIGWIALVVSLVIAIQGIVVQYVVVVEAADASLPGAFVARWISTWIWVLAVGPFLTIFPLTFPNGRLLSRRWRPALVLAFAAIGVQIGVIIVNTQPLGPVPASNNPAVYFAITGMPGAVGYVLLWVAGAVSVSSLVQRYRGAGTEERQQIKWVVYAVVIVAVGAAVGMTPLVLGQFFFLGTAFFAAAAIAIAVLRYRLYEIDVIINRTLVYGALSAVLAGVYTASITLSQRVFMAVTGERSDAAIVLTTLIVAATFTPLKARLQSAVDRRIRTPGPAGYVDPGPNGAAADPLRMLGQLAELRAAGALTAGEFKAKKAELLTRV